MKQMSFKKTMAVFAVSLMFAATGIAAEHGGMKGDTHKKMTKEEHEKLYPKGHVEAQGAGAKDLTCRFDEKEAAYWCPFTKPAEKKEEKAK